MPAWTLKSTATKMLHSLTNGQSQPRERKGSIDIQVHTQRAFFVEPTRETGHVGHRHRQRPPYGLPPKYEKEFARPRPKPLKLRTDENVYPVDEKGKEKGQLVDRRRRYGVTCYPDGVREELRRTRTRSRSPKLNKLDLNSPRFGLDRTISPSLYSNRSGFGDQITVSSAKDDYTFEPPSWFSDHTAKSEDDFCNTVYSYQSSELPSGRILSGATEHGPELDAPLTAKSWETFRIPSIPPSPVDSTPSTESVPVAPRDPRLPPADYLLYKEMYDEAMIRTHGKLPAEWVAYSHRHHPKPSRI